MTFVLEKGKVQNFVGLAILALFVIYYNPNGKNHQGPEYRCGTWSGLPRSS